MPITLSKQQLQQVNDALATIKVAKVEILRAKQAGIDIENEEKEILAQESRLLAIKRVYDTARVK